MITEIANDIKENIKGKVLYDELLSKHTSFGIGGPADIWIEPHDIDDVKNCIRLSRDKNIPLFIIGGGTNLLVKDEGIRGIVVNMLIHTLKNIYCDERGLLATSSLTLKELLNFCVLKGFGGMEFLSGIPGTIGGAVMTNAGARHYADSDKWLGIGDFIEEIKVMDYTGKICILDKDKLNFSYKSSNLNSFVILEARFLLGKTKREGILNECQKFLKRKKETQELNMPSAGCIFKNPPGIDKAAAELIDECGLKGTRIGDALISEKHANFIINIGKARSSNVEALIDVIRIKVNEKFGVELPLEIKIV